MNRQKLTLITLVFATTPLLISCANQEPNNLLVNPGFEERNDKQKAVAWTTSQHAGKEAYKYELDSDVSFQGKQSFRIEQYADQAYGIVRQTSVLPGSENKNVIFTAMLKTEDVVAGKGLRLVLNCRAENSRILKQFQSEPLGGTTDWEKVTLEGAVPEGTVKVDAGIMLQSLGVGWVDDAHLSIK